MVSSVTGPFVTNPGSTGYGAAKAGMDGLMRGLALELGPHGRTANSVAPGWIASGSQVPDEADADASPRSGARERLRRSPRSWRSSPRSRSSYLHNLGQSLVVDGGGNTIQEDKGP